MGKGRLPSYTEGEVRDYLAQRLQTNHLRRRPQTQSTDGVALARTSRIAGMHWSIEPTKKTSGVLTVLCKIAQLYSVVPRYEPINPADTTLRHADPPYRCKLSHSAIAPTAPPYLAPSRSRVRLTTVTIAPTSIAPCPISYHPLYVPRKTGFETRTNILSNVGLLTCSRLVVDYPDITV